VHTADGPSEDTVRRCRPRERVGQDLQRNIATELCISRAIDLAHAALPEERHDFIGAEAGTRTLRRAASPMRSGAANLRSGRPNFRP